MLRAFAILIGLALLGATAHVTILTAGGYGTPHAVLTLAIAAGVGLGALCIGKAWSDRRRSLAMAIGVALLAGELFGLISTGERLIASRDAAQAPLRAASDAIAKAAERLRAAEASLQALPATTPRLAAALDAKAKADAAVAASAAQKSCASNCRTLLQAQVDDAQRDVAAARDAAEAARKRAEGEIAKTRAEFAAMAPPASAAPLADRLGIPAWSLDLIAAALGSIAANGLGCCLLAFGAHGKTAHQAPAIKSASAVSAVRHDEVEIIAPSDMPSLQIAPPLASVSTFLVHSLEPDRRGRVEISALYLAYRAWARSRDQSPLPAGEFGDRLAAIFEKTGLETEHDADRVFCIGAKLVA